MDIWYQLITELYSNLSADSFVDVMMRLKNICTKEERKEICEVLVKIRNDEELFDTLLLAYTLSF